MTEHVNQYIASPALPYAAEVSTNIQASGNRAPPDWFVDYVTGGSKSDSGETVNATTSLGHGSVWQAVNILAGDVGQIPFHKMKRTGKRQGKDIKHPLNIALTCEPNPWQTPSTWKETMMHYALLWGNGISVIQPIGNGRVWLLPLMPDVTGYEEVSPGVFMITTQVNGVDRSFHYDECFHLPGLQTNGFWGVSAVEVARNVIGHGLALQKHGNRVFKNGGKPSGVLQTDNDFNAEAHKNLRAEWNEQHAGADNAGKIAVLWEGLKFMPISMSNEDAQWLDARKLDREFIASLFGLPAFKLNALENSAVRANLEEQNRDYFQTSLSRWTNRLAEEAKRKLLTAKDRYSGKHYFKWFPEAFLRGDIQKRYEAYSSGIASRILSPNEAREKEDLNPYDGGDEYLNPAIEQAGVSGDKPEQDDTEKQQAIATDLIRLRVEEMLRAEAGKAVRALKSSKDFCGWVEKNYQDYLQFAEGFLDSFCAMANAIGMQTSWRRQIERHALDSQQACLMLDGFSDKDSQKELQQTILSQHETLANSILGVE